MVPRFIVCSKCDFCRFTDLDFGTNMGKQEEMETKR